MLVEVAVRVPVLSIVDDDGTRCSRLLNDSRPAVMVTVTVSVVMLG
jgi:hypothetical protein